MAANVYYGSVFDTRLLLVPCALTLAACGGPAPIAPAVPRAMETSVHTTWSDGTYTLEEWRESGEVRFVLSRMDDAYFEAGMRFQEPGGRCVAISASDAPSFDCFEPNRDEWIRMDVLAAPALRTIRVQARSAAMDAHFAADRLTLRPVHPIDLVAVRFAQSVARDAERVADPACEAEYGAQDARCPTLGALLGHDAASLVNYTLRRVRGTSSSDAYAPLDALLALKQTLARAAGFCFGRATLTESCVDQAVDSLFRVDTSEEVRSAHRPARVRDEIATEARGVWMRISIVPGREADDFVEFWPSAENPALSQVQIAESGGGCELPGPTPSVEWQTWRCPGHESSAQTNEYRVRLIDNRLDLRPLRPRSDDALFASDHAAYRTYRRVDILRELIEQAAADVGHRHGSETTAVLGSVIDAVFGNAPNEMATRLHLALTNALTESGISGDDVHRHDASDLVGTYLFGVGASCAESSRRDSAQHEHRAALESFSSCVDRVLVPLARSAVTQYRRHFDDN